MTAPPQVMLSTLAPAKINLHLHVTGRRDDGYHLLDSLVVFAGAGDRVTVDPRPAPAGTPTGFDLEGPFAAALGDTAPADNLVMRAATGLAARLGRPLPARIRLDKHLPVASGIGGGSSDAAAVLRLLGHAWGAGADDLQAVAEGLGADVPMCVTATPCRVTGVGEVVAPLGAPAAAAFAGLHILLVNPLVPLSTPVVFRARAAAGAGFTPAARLPAPDTADIGAWLAALGAAGNDLSGAARSLVPEIPEAEAALGRLAGACFTRMSGSGATCFALFTEAAAAEAAQSLISTARPGWWTATGPLLAGPPEIRETPARSG
ncbi:4-(cytidine 5'-diphospho)-2-C-methyl-D-erythritol kinase [Tistrella mobilis]